MVEKTIYTDTVVMTEQDIKNFIELIGMNKLDAELSHEKHTQYKITIVALSGK